MGRKVELDDETTQSNPPEAEAQDDRDEAVMDMAAKDREAPREEYQHPRAKRRMQRLDILHVRHDDRGGKWWTRVGVLWFDVDSCDFGQIRLDVIPVQYNNSGQVELVAMPPRPRAISS